ncbi:MAG: hypothetical protein LCH93_02995 [Proteobacteria bacterium]|nr:hypothetical protein [Pseudomonadota bacterium]
MILFSPVATNDPAVTIAPEIRATPAQKPNTAMKATRSRAPHRLARRLDREMLSYQSVSGFTACMIDFLRF